MLNPLRRKPAPAATGPTPAPAGPDTAPADEPPGEPTAADVRAQAEDARTTARQGRQGAADLLQDARSEAARLIADAQTQADKLTADATRAGKLAAELDERAGYITHAAALLTQAEDAERQAVALTSEANNLTEQITTVTDRLAELGTQREGITTRLAAAREAADVASVVQLRGQLAGVDEVAPVLDGQRTAAQERLRLIGEAEGAGELAAALRMAQGHREHRERILDILTPSRVQDREDGILRGFLGLAGGNMEAAAHLTAVALNPEAALALLGVSSAPEPQRQVVVLNGSASLPQGA